MALGGSQQPLNLLLGVQIRTGSPRSKREQTGRRNLGSRIGCAPMASEHANETQSPGPIAWLMVKRLHRPLQGQCRRDVGRFFLLQKSRELCQAGSCVAQFEPQAATQSDVILNSVSQWLHRLPPGQGRAMERSETMSTLA